jgi:hypothetical protein
MTLFECFMFLDPDTAPARLLHHAPKEIVAESYVMYWSTSLVVPFLGEVEMLLELFFAQTLGPLAIPIVHDI